MVTFGNIAKVSVTAQLAGIGGSSSDASGMMTRNEMQAKAVTSVMESSIIQPKKKKSGMMAGLQKETASALGELGVMTAQKRAGADTGMTSGNIISVKV